MTFEANMSKMHSRAPAQEEIAEYISEMSAELAALARRENMPMVAYFLQLAGVEAFSEVVAARGEKELDRLSA